MGFLVRFSTFLGGAAQVAQSRPGRRRARPEVWCCPARTDGSGPLIPAQSWPRYRSGQLLSPGYRPDLCGSVRALVPAVDPSRALG